MYISHVYVLVCDHVVCGYMHACMRRPEVGTKNHPPPLTEAELTDMADPGSHLAPHSFISLFEGWKHRWASYLPVIMRVLERSSVLHRGRVPICEF